jgi:hypothetical protein
MDGATRLRISVQLKASFEVRHHLENPCNRLGPGSRVDGPRPEPVGVVGARRVLGLAADELGDGGRLLLADGAALVVVIPGVSRRRGVVLSAEEVRRVVRHAVGRGKARVGPSSLAGGHWRVAEGSGGAETTAGKVAREVVEQVMRRWQ